MDTLHGEQIELDGLFCDRIIAYDTLLIFKSPKYEDYAMYVFSTNSKKHIASLAPIGKGPDECNEISYYGQYVIENNAFKLFVIVDRNSCRWLNVTASLKQGKTVWEPVLGCPSKLKDDYTPLWLLEDGTFLERYSFTRLNDDGTDHIPPGYNVRKFEDETVIKTHKLYRKNVVNNYPTGMYLNGQLYNSSKFIKSDRSKILMGMLFLPQINIIDLNTFKMKGYRLDMGINYETLTKDPAPLKFHYLLGACDDAFIYLSYLGWGISDRPIVSDTHELHVYNWEGALVKRYCLDHPFYMDIDPITGLLYTTNNEDELYCYQLDLL